MTTVATELEPMDLQQQYSETVSNRWDDDWDNENSSARLFERSRIKALAGTGPAPRSWKMKSPLWLEPLHTSDQNHWRSLKTPQQSRKPVHCGSAGQGGGALLMFCPAGVRWWESKSGL